MLKFNKVLKGLKEYTLTLRNNIKNLKFNSFKEAIIKRKVPFVTILLLIIAIFALGNYKSSRNVVLKDFEVALKENKPEKIYRKIKVNDKGINKNDLKPLLEYYSENQTQIENMIKDLKANGKSSFFTIKNEKEFFFDNYKIEIQSFDIKLNTNFENAKIYINDEPIEKSNEKISLIPGKYIIKAKLNTLYGEVSEEQEIFLVENNEYKINLKATNISLSSNFDDADVVINDEKVDKKVKDIVNYGPIPTNGNVNLYLEREFPWGVIKSEKVNIGGLPNINININMVNDKLTKEIDNYANEFYQSVFEALNSSNYNLIQTSNKDVKSKIYDYIRKESLFFRNNYEITELNMEVKNSEFYFEDKTYKANVVVNLNYNVGKKFIPFMKNNINEMFLTKMEYVNEKWQVTDVQKFSIE